MALLVQKLWRIFFSKSVSGYFKTRGGGVTKQKERLFAASLTGCSVSKSIGLKLWRFAVLGTLSSWSPINTSILLFNHRAIRCGPKYHIFSLRFRMSVWKQKASYFSVYHPNSQTHQIRYRKRFCLVIFLKPNLGEEKKINLCL